MKNLSILGLGTALPTHRITQHDAVEFAKGFCHQVPKKHRILEVLYQKSGVETRHSVLLHGSDDSPDRQTFFEPARTNADFGPTTAARMRHYERDAIPLSIRAARIALLESQCLDSEISHLVTISCSGFEAPGVDIALIQNLGLSPSVGRTHVGFMGCHGAINGLRVVQSIVGSDRAACVLMCAVELCSLHLQYGWDTDKLIANSLFADGAAAIVGTSEDARTNSDKISHCCLKATGSYLIPDSLDAMTWRIGDHGFIMTLSKRVPELIRKHVRGWLEQWLHENRVQLDEVGSWAVHPGGPRILDSVQEALTLDEQALFTSRKVLREHGNMSSPTILFILDQLRLGGAPRPYVALAFGPGLVVEAALIE